MKFDFRTKNIDQKLYRRLINTYLLEVDKKAYKALRNWTITLWPRELSSQDPFFYGKNGVGGVTSPGSIRVYINDLKDDVTAAFYPWVRANMVPISHELDHAILISEGFTNRVPLRNNDWGGNKKGTLLPFYTAEIHDRHIENKFYHMDMHWFDWKKMKSIKIFIDVIEIRDLV